MTGKQIYDAAIIGAGVVGALTARELTKYNLKVVLLEKESDAAMGASKANSAIVHAGFDAKPGTLKALLNVRGCKLMPSICEDLGVGFKQKNSLVCAFDGEEISKLEELKRRGEANGVSGLGIISGEKLFDSEPDLSREVKAALNAPSAGIVCPYFLTVAAAENAVMNGCDLILSFEVCKIIKKRDYNYISVTDSKKREIKARYIINCAGLYSDNIAEMCGDGEQIKDFEIIPRKGEYFLMDKNAGSPVKNTLFSAPTGKGKGILISPTVDGNLIIGPTAEECEKGDVSTTASGLCEVERKAKRLVPGLNMRRVITSFAGIRATPKNHDFNIVGSENIPGVLHLIGIESPGLASSPAIAEYAVDKLRDMGLKLDLNLNFNSRIIRRRAFRDMSDSERTEAIKQNNLYSRIICRCESVTEAEIVGAVRSLCPAENIDAVKRRVRAGMGRCQGGFCSPRVAEILARELGVYITGVTKHGGESHILTGKTK
ncbi:MAG: NAD(P)/FAD-dependent oxidoreductase [Oscillospiraceae bacterium]|nr:NAD(P)/FAD-dependent oxidoreductase [Oscillospiraceae bacterium]